jgi:hypothetical protein
MYSISALQAGLTGLIGVRNTKTTDIPAISSGLTATSSGSYWDDYHPLLNTDTLFYSAPNFEAENYGTWSNAVSYTLGTRKIYSNIAYECTVVAGSTIGVLPSALTEWKTVFSAWMGERINSSIANLFNRLATEKKLNLSTKSLFEDVQLFTGAGRLQDTISNNNRMVGLQIDPKKINNIKVVLNNLGVQFTAIQPGFTIYLYHSSRKQAVASMVVTTSVAYKFEWKTLADTTSTLPFDLDFVNFASNIDSGGHWYIAYLESAITGSSIEKKYDFESGPCTGCGDNQNVKIYNLWNKYVDIMPFYFSTGDLDGVNLPDISKIRYTPTTNYGLNLSMSVVPSVTELILKQKHLLAYPLGLQFAVDMLGWMSFNPPLRTNAIRANASQQAILYERDGDANSEGLKQRLNKSISALAEDLSRLSTALPDNKPSPVRYGAI